MGKFDFKDSNSKLHFNAGCMVGCKLWLVSSEFNMLACYDCENNVLDYVTSFPDYNFLKSNLFSDIKYWNGKLFFTPLSSNYIAVYDIETANIQTIILPEKIEAGVIKYNSEVKFRSSVICNGVLYMIPWRYPAIASIDLMSFEVRFYNAWLGLLNGKISQNTGYFWKSVAINDGVIYMASYNSGCIISFDTKNHEFKCIYENKNAAYMSCSYIDGNLFMCDWVNKKLEIIDSRGNYISDYRIECKNYECDNKFVENIFTEKDCMSIFPQSGNAVLRIKVNNVFADVDNQHIYDYENMANSKVFDFICQDKNTVWCLRSDKNVFDIYTTKGKYLKSLQAVISDESFGIAKKKYNSEILTRICNEGADLDLEEFIEKIVDKKN